MAHAREHCEPHVTGFTHCMNASKVASSKHALMVCPTWSASQEAVGLRPSYADAYTGMGVSLKELKKKEEAEGCFQAVVRLRPGCALSLGNLAGTP